MDSSKIHSYILSADCSHPRTAQNCWEPLGCSSCARVVWVRCEKLKISVDTADPDIPDLQGSSHSSVILNGIITTHNDLYMTYSARSWYFLSQAHKLSHRSRECEAEKILYKSTAGPTLMTRLVTIIIKMFTDPIIVLSSCGNNRCWCCCLQEWFAFIITRWKMNIKASVISWGWYYIVTFPMLCNYFTNLYSCIVKW